MYAGVPTSGPRQRQGVTDFRVECFRDTEIGDLDGSVRCYEDVLGLEVAVHGSASVRVCEAGEETLEHPDDLRKCECAQQGRSDPRSRYSIAMNGVPSCSKYS